MNESTAFLTTSSSDTSLSQQRKKESAQNPQPFHLSGIPSTREMQIGWNLINRIDSEIIVFND